MKFCTVFLFLVLTVFTSVESKRFTKCTLARELFQRGIPKSELPDWVCLVRWESNYQTNAMNKNNRDGSWDYGLFQINDKWWCKGHIKSHNACGLSCNELLKDDISKAVTCARLIKRQQGFRAWYGWLNHCTKVKPSIHECF